MSKSVLSRPTVTKSQDRNPFDVSCFRNYHQSLGMLIPVYCKAFPAGTKGSFNRFVFTRTKKVLYPAFQGVHECIDVFKVPIRLLWSQWNDWKLNINDLNYSSLMNVVDNSGSLSPDLNLPNMVPRFDFGNNAHTKLTSSDSLERISVFNESLRLVDSLRYGQKTVFSSVSNVMSVFKLAAYQKIYFDHYRNTAYESNDPYAYNLDFASVPGTLTINGLLSPTDNIKSAHCLHELFQLRRVNLRNDAMHNIYPSLNYVLTKPTGSNWSLPSSVVGAESNNAQTHTYVLSSDSVTNNFGSSVILHPQDNNSIYTGFSAQSIRAMFALDKLMRASAYAPKHVKDQFKARFGVDLPDSVQLHSERLGSFKNDVIFGEVTSTANTASSGSNLGDVGGKGVGSADWNKKPIPFYCEEDSIIMALHYFTIDAVYDSYNVDEWNTKLAREDFFQPEFQNLGLRPFYRKFLNNTGTLTEQNQILGYTVPNQSYKIEPDMNTGIFNDSFTQVKVDNTTETISSPLRAFVSHMNYQDGFASGDGVNWRYFKVYPIMLDSIFQEEFDPCNYLTDQFYGHLKFRVPVVEPMSVHGQPSL